MDYSGFLPRTLLLRDVAPGAGSRRLDTDPTGWPLFAGSHSEPISPSAAAALTILTEVKGEHFHDFNTPTDISEDKESGTDTQHYAQ